MKRRTKVILATIAGLFAITGCCWYAMSSIGPATGLGLTWSDLAMGGHPDVEALRSSAKTVADAFLEGHAADLARACGGPYRLTVNYNLSPRARALGYRSSFYYFCWNVYLPYLLTTESGKDYLVLVQLSDRTKGNKHDPNDFRVLRVLLLDSANQLKAQFGE